jgi:hypothetical protein
LSYLESETFKFFRNWFSARANYLRFEEGELSSEDEGGESKRCLKKRKNLAKMKTLKKKRTLKSSSALSPSLIEMMRLETLCLAHVVVGSHLLNKKWWWKFASLLGDCYAFFA